MDADKPILNTDRLLLKPLEECDWSFMLELVNTEGWLTFIGDRNVKNEIDAKSYVRKIIADKNIIYWVVRVKEKNIGLITLIKRDHLPFHDIGFAFLPNFQGHGYAYESARAILEWVIKRTDHPTLLAATMPNNARSIGLIEKLGFSFDKTTVNDEEKSCLYCLDLEKLKIDRLIKTFFSAFTNKGAKPRLNLIYEMCLPQATIVKNTGGLCETYDLRSFVEPRESLLNNGELRQFEEYEIEEKTIITRNIAQRFSKYEKVGILNKQPFSEKGNKMFQLVKVHKQWKICQVIWDDE